MSLGMLTCPTLALVEVDAHRGRETDRETERSPNVCQLFTRVSSAHFMCYVQLVHVCHIAYWHGHYQGIAISM